MKYRFRIGRALEIWRACGADECSFQKIWGALLKRGYRQGEGDEVLSFE